MGREDEVSMIERAVQLLWVIARCDVENLSGRRGQALRELRDIETRTGAPSHFAFYEQLLGAVEANHE